MIGGITAGTTNSSSELPPTGAVDQRGGRRGRDLEERDHRRDEEDERQHRHRPDEEAVAPEVAQLLAHDRADPLARSSGRLDVLRDQLEVDVLERVPLLAEREDVRAGGDERARDGRGGELRVGDRDLVRARAVRLPAGRLPVGRGTRSRGRAAVPASSTSSRFRKSRSRSSSVRPIVRSVVLRIATRSHSRSASSSRWVVRKTVTPRSRRPSIRSCTSRVATGSRPDVGSSRKSTAGSLRSARARPTRWRRPFERSPQRSSARSARPTASSAAGIRVRGRGCRTDRRRTRGSRSPSAAGRGPGASGMTAICWRIADAVRGREREARDDCRARGRRDQRPEHAHGRRLAGAVWAEEAEDLSGCDRERDVVDGDSSAEPLRQMLDRERRCGPPVHNLNLGAVSLGACPIAYSSTASRAPGRRHLPRGSPPLPAFRGMPSTTSPGRPAGSRCRRASSGTG